MDLLNGIFRLFSNKLFYNFIKEDRFIFLVRGWIVSIEVTFFAAVLGVIIGLFIAIAKLSGKGIIKAIADWYIEVIRGTPTVVQLTITYFVIFASVDIPKIVVASIAFGINSGAYVAEIIRAGIQAVDKGQMEAARSVGLSYPQAMRYVIIPQAIKNILPAIGNEFIVLLKETSVSGYIALDDLTRGGTTIRSLTYDAMTPLLTVAYIYFLMTASLSALLSKFERRLRQSD
ncbi:MAG: amino acid ABC transporter permease [Clostridia bacterium]|jgi:His/Glu/Gln/Arg/opine family amino acid ABC transporter permease subunit